jgi:nucleotide-binding universal stress UspA family protein
MKKILLTFDGTQFSEAAFEFVRQLNKVQSVLVTGIFVPQLSYSNLWSYATGVAGPEYIPLVEEEYSEAVEANIQRFQQLCQQNKIAYTVHKDFFDFALPEIRKESRFADLLIIASESFYRGILGADANEYIKDVLHSTECPVFVVPEKFNCPQRNILAYDGSGSSVYAIKQYAYLFPELCRNETLLIYFSEEEVAIPEKHRIEELVQQHFKQLSFLNLKIDPRKQLATWLNEIKDAVLVCGSFGRPFLSEIFKKSFVSEVIFEHKLPVFIAHRKS